MKNIWWMAAVAILIWIGAQSSANPYGPAETAFNATGAIPSGYSLNGWVSLPASKHPPGLSRLVARLARRAHVRGPVRSSVGLSYRQAEILSQRGSVRTQVIVERLASGATYAVVNRSAGDGFYGLSQSIRWADRLMGGARADHLAVNLEGYVHRRLNAADACRLIARAFSTVGAHSVNRVATSKFVSVTGDTSVLSHHNVLQGRPINLQVAVNYNAYLHATEVLVGTPLLTVTY